MIKTIILDESKVNYFLKGLEDIKKKASPLAFVSESFVTSFAIDSIERLLESTKIEPKTTKTHKQ